MIQGDFESLGVSADIINLCRDPELAFQNVTERKDFYGNDPSSNTIILTEQNNKIDKDTIRQLALYKAIKNNDFETRKKLMTTYCTEIELHAYIEQGLDLDNLAHFSKKDKAKSSGYKGKKYK